MKRIAILGIVVVLLFTLTGGTVLAAKPTTFTVQYNQAQFQWRAWVSYGDWSSVYQNYSTSSDYKLTGNVLHTSFSYQPVVTDEEGASSIYTYNKKTDCWIQHEGTISYKYAPYYGDYIAVNYWRGYLEFDGTPSADSFEHGVGYQWVYIYAPNNDETYDSLDALGLTYAQWDETMGAWLVGYSVYLWDSDTQAYDVTSPFQFIEPVPASDYNPLGL